MLLTVSISTIKAIRAGGVPDGTKWANMISVEFNHPYTMNITHNGRASDRVTRIWLVAVNTKGVRPRKLLIEIRPNTARKNSDAPGA